MVIYLHSLGFVFYVCLCVVEFKRGRAKLSTHMKDALFHSCHNEKTPTLLYV